MIFFLLFGLFLMTCALFLFGVYINILRKSRCAVGEVCGIGDGVSYSRGGTAHLIEVRFNQDGKDVKGEALNHFFLIPFWRKRRLSRLRAKHIGRQVHIYYNPDNQRQILLREYLWREFLLCAFIFLLGSLFILAGIYKWY